MVAQKAGRRERQAIEGLVEMREMLDRAGVKVRSRPPPFSPPFLVFSVPFLVFSVPFLVFSPLFF